MRKITRVILHTSDSPDTLDIGVKEITRWHVERGFKTVGYHAIVRRNGAIEWGRPSEQAGAHVKGHNHDSLGIVWVGRTRMTAAQRESVIEQIWDWLDEYNLTVNDVYGHSDFDKGKTCPNLDIKAFREELRKWAE